MLDAQRYPEAVIAMAAVAAGICVVSSHGCDACHSAKTALLCYAHLAIAAVDIARLQMLQVVNLLGTFVGNSERCCFVPWCPGP